MENSIVEVSVRNVYGMERIYPVNKNAEIFASLTGKKTLDHSDIQKIKSLGFEIKEAVRKNF